MIWLKNGFYGIKQQSLTHSDVTKLLTILKLHDYKNIRCSETFEMLVLDKQQK
jgi:hypothetical protein